MLPLKRILFIIFMQCNVLSFESIASIISCGVLKGNYFHSGKRDSFRISSCDANSSTVVIKYQKKVSKIGNAVFNASFLVAFSFPSNVLSGTFYVVNNATLQQHSASGIIEWNYLLKQRKVVEIHVVGLHADNPAEASRVEAFVAKNFPPQIRDFPYYIWSRIGIGGCPTYNYKGLTARTHSPGKLVAIAYAHIQVWEDFVIRNKVNNVVPPERYNDTIILLESDAVCNMENCGGLSLDLLG